MGSARAGSDVLRRARSVAHSMREANGSKEDRSVQFDQCVKVLLVPSRKEYTPQMSSDVWWSQEDVLGFRRRAFQLWKVHGRLGGLELEAEEESQGCERCQRLRESLGGTAGPIKKCICPNGAASSPQVLAAGTADTDRHHVRPARPCIKPPACTTSPAKQPQKLEHEEGGVSVSCIGCGQLINSCECVVAASSSTTLAATSAASPPSDPVVIESDESPLSPDELNQVMDYGMSLAHTRDSLAELTEEGEPPEEPLKAHAAEEEALTSSPSPVSEGVPHPKEALAAPPSSVVRTVC
ncbi:unnamed protein product [Chrysoparadoxa australica]